MPENQEYQPTEEEKKYGFPCSTCGARNFEEAGNLCRSLGYCPGETMSREVFAPSLPLCTEMLGQVLNESIGQAHRNVDEVKEFLYPNF